MRCIEGASSRCWRYNSLWLRDSVQDVEDLPRVIPEVDGHPLDTDRAVSSDHDEPHLGNTRHPSHRLTRLR